MWAKTQVSNFRTFWGVTMSLSTIEIMATGKFAIYQTMADEDAF